MKFSSNDQQPWIFDILRELRKHSLTLVFIVLIYLLFWVVPQINDLIITIVQAQNNPLLRFVIMFVFYALLTVFAFLISNAKAYFNPPKAIITSLDGEKTSKQGFKVFQMPMDNKELFRAEARKKGKAPNNYDDFEETQAQYIERMLPKFLGAYLLLIVTYSVNNVYNEAFSGEIVILGNWGLLIWLVLFIILLNKKWGNAIIKKLNKHKWFEALNNVLLFVCLAGILVLGVFNHRGSDKDTVLLFYSLLLLSLFYLIISISYTKFILDIKKKWGVKVIVSLTILTLLCYIILWANPSAFELLTPLPIVVICIIGIYSIASLLKLLGLFVKLPVLPITVLICTAFGFWTASKSDFKHYEASSVSIKNDSSLSPKNRLALDTYIDNWIEDRKQDILNSKETKPFPIVLVSAEGGGSRAGLWSLLVQGYLYDNNPNYFKKNLFALTGASGGGVGNNIFYTQAYNLQEQKSKIPFCYPKDSLDGKLKYRGSTFYNSDYLSSSVASLLGRDLFKSILDFPITFKDRGALLEIAWEQKFKQVFHYPEKENNPLGEAYLQLKLDTTDQYIKPLLITNTTFTQTGERAIISPVKTEKDKHNMEVFFDVLGNYPNDNRMLKRSTAMSMNARFPYISPLARIDCIGQFGDAGYYNNIGGSVALRLASALKNKLKKDTSLKGKYKIKHLLLTNYERPINICENCTTKPNYSSQLTGPLVTIKNATFAHPKEMEKTLKDTISVQSKRTAIAEEESILNEIMGAQTANKQMKPFIPLGRYLSEPAVLSMEARLEMVKPRLNKILD